MKYNENVLERLEHLEDEMVVLRRRVAALEGAEVSDCLCSGQYEECEVCMGT